MRQVTSGSQLHPPKLFCKKANTHLPLQVIPKVASLQSKSKKKKESKCLEFYELEMKGSYLTLAEAYCGVKTDVVFRSVAKLNGTQMRKGKSERARERERERERERQTDRQRKREKEKERERE